MDAAIKEKWVEALRSGPYRQGHEYLRPDDQSFCCLGVLCDVINKDGWVKRHNIWFYGDPVNNQTCFLPFKAEMDAGLSADATTILLEMNDGGKTFAEIADYIEENL